MVTTPFTSEEPPTTIVTTGGIAAVAATTSYAPVPMATTAVWEARITTAVYHACLMAAAPPTWAGIATTPMATHGIAKAEVVM